MGRETYTFKLNEQKISTTLADALQNEKSGGLSFFDYIVKENEGISKYSSSKQLLNAGEIISTLKKEPAKANALCLGLAMNWLWELEQISYKYTEDLVSIFARYGFEQIYELGQKDKCWVYLNQLSAYEDMNDVKEDTYDGQYYLWENDAYKDGLDYLLVLLSKVCLDKDYKIHLGYYRSEEYSKDELNFLTDYKKDERLIEQAESELIEIRTENEEEDLKEDADPNYRRPVTASHYLVASEMFSQIKEVQERIKDYTGKIFILDN